MKERLFTRDEARVLGFVDSIPHMKAMSRETLLMCCMEKLPVPAQGERDRRRVRMSAVVTNLCKGKDAPFKETAGIVHFLVA